MYDLHPVIHGKRLRKICTICLLIILVASLRPARPANTDSSKQMKPKIIKEDSAHITSEDSLTC